MSDVARSHSSATLMEAASSIVSIDPAIASTWSGARLVGRAFTVQGAGGDNLALHLAVLQARPGDVLVVDVNGAPYGHWGEVLTVAAQQRGIAGLLIDGGVRDRADLKRLSFPVFSRNDAIRGTRKHFVGVTGGAVRVGGVDVHPGDLIVGDADGVVAIPAADVSRVLDKADQRVEQEKAILDRLRSGARTIDLYEFGTAHRRERG